MGVTITDLSLDAVTLESLPRLQKLRQLHFDTTPEICLEIPRLMTQYLKQLDDSMDPPDPTELRAGKMYEDLLSHKEPHIHNDNLLAGTTTSKPKGVPLYPDMAALSIWPELETIARRKKNRFDIAPEEIKELNLEIAPYWLDRTVQELARKQYHNPRCQQVMERIVFFLVTKANCIGHTIPNYAELVNRGLQAVMDEARDKELSLGNSGGDQEKRAFYQAVQRSLQGILTYAANLSRYAADLAQGEADPVRKQELLTMSQVCQRVPAQPPTSFQEAVNAVWLYKVALHQESANIALSPGRLDQVLYPAFRQDLERSRENGGAAGEQAFLKEAVELVGCLWLNICDHVPLAPEASETLFGGSGCNQAVTLGGVDMDGMDAVNDLTYVMLKATELLKLRDPNVNARYYPGINSQKYLGRLCDVNIKTNATPCFHNDKSVIEALQGQGVSPGARPGLRRGRLCGTFERRSHLRAYGRDPDEPPGSPGTGPVPGETPPDGRRANQRRHHPRPPDHGLFCRLPGGFQGPARMAHRPGGHPEQQLRPHLSGQSPFSHDVRPDGGLYGKRSGCDPGRGGL